MTKIEQKYYNSFVAKVEAARATQPTKPQRKPNEAFVKACYNTGAALNGGYVNGKAGGSAFWAGLTGK